MTQPEVLNGITFPTRDYVVIGGDASPGKCTIRNLNSPREWDIRQGYGLSGATVVPKGDALSRFSVLFEFWDETQIALWYSFASKYFDKAARLVPGSRVPKALGIEHPILSAPPHRITEVVVEDVSGLEQDEEGKWSTEVFFLQYRKPKPALSPPDASIPATTPATPTAEDAADREMAEKLKTLKGLL